MANLSSNKIKVYPTGYRGSNYNNESYVNSETNLNNLSSRLTYRPSYISEEVAGHIKFVVDGYLFECDKSDITALIANPSENTIIYAVIKTCEVEVSNTKYKTLIPSNASVPAILDSAGDNFLGVDFDTVVPTPEQDATYTINSLPLYKYDGTNWNLIASSLLRFSTTHISNSVGDSTKAISEELTTEDIYADKIELDAGSGDKTTINHGTITTKSIVASTSIKDSAIIKASDAKVYVDTTGELKSDVSTSDSGDPTGVNIRPYYVNRVQQDSKGVVTASRSQMPYATSSQPGIIKLSYDSVTGVLTINTTD